MNIIIYKRKNGENEMGEKGLDFKHKEVINISDAKRMGYVQDVTADLETGVITSIIVPGNNKMFNIFRGNNEIIIPWDKIKCISGIICHQEKAHPNSIGHTALCKWRIENQKHGQSIRYSCPFKKWHSTSILVGTFIG